jgi:hypothetical protein
VAPRCARDIDLLNSWWRSAATDSARSRVTLRFPNQASPEVMAASATRLGRVFLDFSRFPAARSFVDPSGAATVRWNDMRFAGGVMSLDQPRRPDPFTATVRLSPDGRVLQEQLGR